MHRGHYIVLTHTYHAMKDNPGKHEVFEKCEFVDDLKNRHMMNATAILDFMNKKMIKSRVKDSTFEAFIKHIEKTHPKEYGEFKAYMKEQFPEKFKEFGDTEVKVDSEGTVSVD